MAAMVGVTPSPRSGQALSRSEGACPERSEGSPRRQPRQRRCFAAAQHDGTRQFQLDSPLACRCGLMIQQVLLVFKLVMSWLVVCGSFVPWLALRPASSRALFVAAQAPQTIADPG